jgi:hypothetical protein
MLFDVGEHIGNIRTAWHKATESIHEVAEACAKADDAVGVDMRKRFFENLPFSRSTFSKLVAIAHDKRLSDPKIRDSLPPNYSIHYELTHFDDREFEAFFGKRPAKSPPLKRAAIVRWRKQHRGELKKQPNDPRLSGRSALHTNMQPSATKEPANVEAADNCVLQVDASHLPDDERLNLYRDLERAAQSYGLTVTGLPSDLVERLIIEREAA